VLLLAVLASIATLPRQAQATVRIVGAQRVTSEEWKRSNRKREVVAREDGLKVRVRLIEFE